MALVNRAWWTGLTCHLLLSVPVIPLSSLHENQWTYIHFHTYFFVIFSRYFLPQQKLNDVLSVLCSLSSLSLLCVIQTSFGEPLLSCWLLCVVHFVAEAYSFFCVCACVQWCFMVFVLYICIEFIIVWEIFGNKQFVHFVALCHLCFGCYFLYAASCFLSLNLFKSMVCFCEWVHTIKTNFLHIDIDWYPYSSGFHTCSFVQVLFEQMYLGDGV